MSALFSFLFLVCLILLVIGLFKPGSALFWDKKTPTKKKSAMVYGGLVILFMILAGATASTGTGTSKDASEPTAAAEPVLTPAQKDSIAKAEQEKQQKEIADNTVTAGQLTATYEENEVAADNNLKGKTFYVKGKVKDIKKDIIGDIYVILEGDEMFRNVQCYFEDKDAAAQLHKGMVVTFKGRCEGLMMNVLMKDCALVQ